jgi:hypothetical protein
MVGLLCWAARESAENAARLRTMQGAQDVLEHLSADDRTLKLQALRRVKNSIIGNRTKKIFYSNLGAVGK